jgi:hypothetical protein
MENDANINYDGHGAWRGMIRTEDGAGWIMEDGSVVTDEGIIVHEDGSKHGTHRHFSTQFPNTKFFTCESCVFACCALALGCCRIVRFVSWARTPLSLPPNYSTTTWREYLPESRSHTDNFENDLAF